MSPSECLYEWLLNSCDVEYSVYQCATALGSSFNPALINEVGVFLAEETRYKSSVILLAPTCNIQRSPLGGRSFESFSEDPHLSGKDPYSSEAPQPVNYLHIGILAAAYVNGLQFKGVASTIKHFVANDQEHERTAVDSVMSDRALREIYLYPCAHTEHASRSSFEPAFCITPDLC